MLVFPGLTARLDSIVDRIATQLRCRRDQLRDWGFCHGDFTDGNMRLDKQTLSIFDFDWCGSGWHVFDVATFRWMARLVGAEACSWEPFRKGYLQVRPDAADSLELTSLFVVLRHFWHTATCLQMANYLGAGALTDEFFEDFVEFCEQANLRAP